jgi:hypothetical protein
MAAHLGTTLARAFPVRFAIDAAGTRSPFPRALVMSA